jgi:hypothetical protein
MIYDNMTIDRERKFINSSSKILFINPRFMNGRTIAGRINLSEDKHLSRGQLDSLRSLQDNKQAKCIPKRG